MSLILMVRPIDQFKGLNNNNNYYFLFQHSYPSHIYDTIITEIGRCLTDNKIYVLYHSSYQKYL
jgi:hypothetical protein